MDFGENPRKLNGSRGRLPDKFRVESEEIPVDLVEFQKISCGFRRKSKGIGWNSWAPPWQIWVESEENPVDLADIPMDFQWISVKIQGN